MHEYASAVRQNQPDASWAVFRAPDHYIALLHAKSPAAAATHDTAAKPLFDALAPLLAGDVEHTTYDLVTSSDLQRRHRR